MENNLPVVQNTNQEPAGQDLELLNAQFANFLHTKGIKAKFRLAMANMSESARQQHEADKAAFEAVKAQSAEDNKEFVEFLHTKGVKAKADLVIENVKKGAAEASHKTAAQIAGAPSPSRSGAASEAQPVSAEALSNAFNAFLQEKGLADQYHVIVTDGEEQE